MVLSFVSYSNTKTPYIQPTDPLQTWKGQEYKDWPSTSGICFVGKVNVLRLEITMLMNQAGGSPSILRQ